MHRLDVLGVDWGTSPESGQGAGTFRESFQLCWRLELAVELVAANLHRNTIAIAAESALRERAIRAHRGGAVTACTQIDDEPAAAMVGAIGRAHRACLLLEHPALDIAAWAARHEIVAAR